MSDNKVDFSLVRELLLHLHDPEKGCPWDCKQTAADYCKYLRNEAKELFEAVESGDGDHICEEAGDVLWNLLAIIELAGEKCGFSHAQVAERVTTKMRDRHPHVFGDVKAETMEEALAAFMEAKKREQYVRRTR